MLADGTAEAHYLSRKLLSRKVVEVFVHYAYLLSCELRGLVGGAGEADCVS
jgi:hypothetical protein